MIYKRKKTNLYLDIATNAVGALSTSTWHLPLPCRPSPTAPSASTSIVALRVVFGHQRLLGFCPEMLRINGTPVQEQPSNHY